MATEPKDTLASTFARFFGDWEGEDCAVRNRQFRITDQKAYAERIARESAAAEAQNQESLRRAIAQADDC
jgi:hypothetical protein